jgi:hypothetical protein
MFATLTIMAAAPIPDWASAGPPTSSIQSQLFSEIKQTYVLCRRSRLNKKAPGDAGAFEV